MAWQNPVETLEPSGLKTSQAEEDAYTLELEKTIAALERERNSLRGYNRKLKGSLADQRRVIRELETHNQDLLNSTSWRVTRPMRAAAQAYRSLGREVWRLLGGSTAPETPVDPEVEAFRRDGFILPFHLFTRAQCDLIIKHNRLNDPDRQKQTKGRGATDRFFYDVTTRPAILDRVKRILGDDIVWWGTRVIRREPNQIHCWHTDIESSAPDGRFVSVWVGLCGTQRDSGLKLISRSHQFGKPIQQEVHERGSRRGEATDDMVAEWARALDPQAALVQPDIADGQAIVFDGRLWHASHNVSSEVRVALLLQYAAADMPISSPDPNHLEWPFRYTDEELPRVLVSGRTETKTLPPPPAAPRRYEKPITTNVHFGEGFLPGKEGWKPYKLFRGPTPSIDFMKAHVSVLSPGYCPHPPHCHVEEELLIVLDGEAEIVLPDGPNVEGARVERLLPGGFGYYPAYRYHTIRNVSSAPVTYLMFKWQGPPVEVADPLQTVVRDIGGRTARPSEKPRSMEVLFQGPTAYLGKLHAHVTDLQPGAGYEPHADKYDVAILVFSGQVETLGQTVGPGASIWYSAGQLHGMRNVGSERARYLVLEFHGAKA